MGGLKKVQSFELADKSINFESYLLLPGKFTKIVSKLMFSPTKSSDPMLYKAI